MRSLMERVDHFCYTHPRFGIRNLMLYIVIANAVIWLFGMMDTTGILQNALRFSSPEVFSKGQIWRLLTFVLLPDPSMDGFFFLIALYFYYWIGSTLEKYWGVGKFTIFYLMGMFFTMLYCTLIWLILKVDVGAYSTYINLSMFLAFATLFPDTTVLLFFIIPVKMKWLGIISAALFILPLFFSAFPMNLLPLIALLNYLIFCGGWLFDFFRPARLKQEQNTINFRKAAKKYNKQQAKKQYNRKCDVCGRTDTDFPDLEFRFCSKCAGYHCFCIDHINSHVHFKE